MKTKTQTPFEECDGCGSWISPWGCTSPDTCPLIADKVNETEFDTMHDNMTDEDFDYDRKD